MCPKNAFGFLILIVLSLVAPLATQAAQVGRFTQLSGNVDLLKQGKIPGVPARVQEGVEPGDVVRTKSKSKAQLTMVDDSVITLAPETRLAVADYTYNAASRQRRAVLRVFRGLVHTLVTRLLDVEQPNFLMETHTAGLGVRGTEWYTLLAPGFTSVYLVQGLVDVHSNLPTLPAVLPLKSGEFTQIFMGQQPRLPLPLTPEMLLLLRRFMDTGVQDRALLGGGILIPAGGRVPAQLPEGLEKIMQPTIPPSLPPGPTITPTPAPRGGGGPTG
jgi:hypothetical protein